MRAEWPWRNVTELQEEGVLLVEDGNHGEYRPRPSEFQRHGTAFIRAADMDGDGRIFFSTADGISEVALDRIRKGKGQPGDVLFSHKGTVGKMALVPDDAPPFVCSPQTTFWRTLNASRLDRRFLYAFMRSDGFRRQWFARKGETDMADYVSLTAQRTFVLPLPPLEEQRAIAGVVSLFDDKIEANRALNETLEATCQALFRSWFVDFDPVVAKSEGRRPPHLTDEVAALFPDRFEDSPIGPVPAGWRVGTVGDIATNPRRKAEPARVAPSTPYIGLEHMPRRSIVLDAWGQAAAVTSAKWGFLCGEVLFGKLRPYFHKVGVALCDGICSTDILVVDPKQEHDFGVLLGTLSSSEFVDYADGTAGGTRQPRTSWHDMARFTIAIPPEPIRAQLTRVTRSAEDHFRTHAAETRTLTALRDMLLPRLLSGELRVRQAETLVEEAI